MSDQSAQLIWKELETTADQLLSGTGDSLRSALRAREAMALLMELEPAEIMACIEGSHLPTRAVVSWLVYECTRLPEVDPKRVEGLRDYWSRQYASDGDLIPPPPSA